MIITSPTEARKDFYQLLKNVNNNHEPIYISGNKYSFCLIFFYPNN
ncbi:type II toxin-antitoxin system Phd/YefM family antitoxin, partial [Staphylococcus aureus]